MKVLLLSLTSLALASAARAALIINVDPATKNYFVSGSATGTPGSTGFGPFLPRYDIFWDNGQAYSIPPGDSTNLLTQSAFTVTGNTPTSFVLFIHANGNVNGSFEFSSGATTTLTADSNYLYSYAGWSTTLIHEIEDKARLGETVPVTSGSSAFALSFAVASSAVPERTPTAGLVGTLTLIGVALRRRRPSLAP